MNNLELLKKHIFWLVGSLSSQIKFVEKVTINKFSLEKNHYNYGYIYGYVDNFFQINPDFSKNEDAFMYSFIQVITSVYGPDGKEIIKKIGPLFDDELFIRGCKIGGNELNKLINYGTAPTGLIDYIIEKQKK